MKKSLVLLATVITLFGCSNHAPMATVDYVDIDRFMGDWYVIANIPTFLEEGAHNAVETYEKSDDGTIATTFTFREGGFDGDLKKYNPTGYIEDSKTNALWGMQFIWPIKADYRIVYLDDDYTKTVIGREARDARLSQFLRVYPQLVADPKRRPERVDMRYTHGFAVRWRDAQVEPAAVKNPQEKV